MLPPIQSHKASPPDSQLCNYNQSVNKPYQTSGHHPLLQGPTPKVWKAVKLEEAVDECQFGLKEKFLISHRHSFLCTGFNRAGATYHAAPSAPSLSPARRSLVVWVGRVAVKLAVTAALNSNKWRGGDAVEKVVE